MAEMCMYSCLESFFQLFHLNIPRLSKHFKSKISTVTFLKSENYNNIKNIFKLVSTLRDICFPPLVSVQLTFSFSRSCVQPVQWLILQEIKYYVIDMTQENS